MTAAGAPRLAYRPELDALRGIAVLLVFLQHAQIVGFVRAGWIGVTMFFTLSGYLITSLLQAELRESGRVDLGRFWMRRAVRLLPALIGLLVFVVILGFITGQSLWLQELVTLFYVSNWANVAGVDMSFLGHTWSLAIEEQFYILWPLALLLVRPVRWQVALCAGGIVASVALRFLLFGPDPAAQNRWSHGLDTRGDALLVGCLLALVGWKLPRWTGWIGMLGILCTLFFFQTTSGLAHVGLLLTAAATAVLIASRFPLGARPLIALGGISYGVYLWHFPIIESTRWLASTVPAPIMVASWFGATLLAAFASRRLIELPALRWRDSSPRQIVQHVTGRKRFVGQR